MVRRELYGKGVYDSVKMEGLPVGVQIVSISFCFSDSSARRIERLGPDLTGHSTVPRGKGVGDYEAIGRGFTCCRGEGRGLEGSGGWEGESRVGDEELRLFKCFRECVGVTCDIASLTRELDARRPGMLCSALRSMLHLLEITLLCLYEPRISSTDTAQSQTQHTAVTHGHNATYSYTHGHSHDTIPPHPQHTTRSEP
jgi:hypothetical protein